MEQIRPLEKLREIAEKLGVPYAIDKYIGSAESYVVYRMTGMDGEAYADDRAQAHIAHVRFDYIQPIQKSYNDVMFSIIDMFIEAGFSEPDIVIVNDDNKDIILQFTAEFVI